MKTKKSAKKPARKSGAFESIRRGLIEARDHAHGLDVGARIHEVRIDAPPDVAAIRAKTGLSQIAFAKSIGVAVGTLQGWEQGRRRPDGPARVLLALIDKRPRIVQDELAAGNSASGMGRPQARPSNPRKAAGVVAFSTSRAAIVTPQFFAIAS